MEDWVEVRRTEGLALTFTELQLEAIFKDMKSDTALGPDVFPVMFFKQCWPLVKNGVLYILIDFVLGVLTLRGSTLASFHSYQRFLGQIRLPNSA
jgi:hypothetical protein